MDLSQQTIPKIRSLGQGELPRLDFYNQKPILCLRSKTKNKKDRNFPPDLRETSRVSEKGWVGRGRRKRGKGEEVVEFKWLNL